MSSPYDQPAMPPKRRHRVRNTVLSRTATAILVPALVVLAALIAFAVVKDHQRHPDSSASAGSNSPPPNQQPFNPAAHGMLRDGALWTSCKLTYMGGGVVANGAKLDFYNPGPNAVHVYSVGVELIDNGILAGQLPVQTGEFPGPVPAGIDIPLPIGLTPSPLTSCWAGWQP
jgi:hypothetical protein